MMSLLHINVVFYVLLQATLVLSMYPTPHPSSEEVCGDNPDFRIKDDPMKPCSWIAEKKSRRSKYCKEPEVYKNCRLNCYICCYNVNISSKSEYCTFNKDAFIPPDDPPFTHPRFTEEVLTKEIPGKGQDPDYGVLKQLAGTWVNYSSGDKVNFGLHSTILPSPGTNPNFIFGKFHYLCENYTEKLKFTLLDVASRNRAGANEQFIGAVKYEQVITSEAGKGIHDEVGMYLWLKDMYSHPATEESVKEDLGKPELLPGDGGAISDTFLPPFSIARSGTIPHGSTIQLLGTNVTKVGKPQWPNGTNTWDFDTEHLSITPSMGGKAISPKDPINLDEPAPKWVHDPTLLIRDASSARSYTQRIFAHYLYPYSVRPDLRLRDTIKDQEITRHTLLELSTTFNDGQSFQGGVLNTPLISKSSPVKKTTVRIWLEKVRVDNGKGGTKIIDQLQYEQVSFFVFGFGREGNTIWPHIQVNTLRREEDVGTSNEYVSDFPSAEPSPSSEFPSNVPSMFPSN